MDSILTLHFPECGHNHGESREDREFFVEADAIVAWAKSLSGEKGATIMLGGVPCQVEETKEEILKMKKALQ